MWTEPLRVFGIPLSGMCYYMNWVMTNAQLELIAADVGVVDYGTMKKDKEKKPKKGEFDDTKADAGAVKRAGEKWLEKYGGDADAGAGLSAADILGSGFTADVGVKLSD